MTDKQSFYGCLTNLEHSNGATSIRGPVDQSSSRGRYQVLSPDGLRSLKIWFLEFAHRAAHDLETRYPSLRGKGFTFLLGVYSLILGTSQLAFPPESVREFVCQEEVSKPSV